MNKHIKTVITAVCAVAILVCIAISIKDEIPSKKEETTTVNMQTGTDATGNPLPRVVTDSNGITKAILDSSQICDNSKPIIINRYNSIDGRLAESVEIVISDAIISREFKNYDEVREERTNFRNWVNKFYDEEIIYADANETFNNGIAFYVYLTVTVTNRHTEERTLSINMVPSAVSLNNGAHEAIRCVGSEYGKEKYMEYGLYNDVTHSIHKGGIEPYVDGDKSNVYQYKTGESRTSEIVLRIPDEYIKNDNLYLCEPFGMNFNKANSDINQKYIKVNITNRGDYFE